MLKLVREVDQTKLFTKLTTLGMPDYLSNWPLQAKAYDFLDITKEDAPELIALATDLELFDSESELERYAPVHAWRILSEIAAKDAIEPLILRFDDYHDCDWAYDELPKVIAAINGSDSLDKIKNHLFGKSKDTYSRIMAADTLREISRIYPNKTNECTDIIANCLDESSAGFDDFNAILVSLLVDMQAVSKINNIRRAFEANCVDIRFAGDLEDAEIRLGLRKDRDTPPPVPFLDLEDILWHAVHCPVCSSRASTILTKVGRNDPCHCGSGKKYKKCCLE